MYRTLQTFWRWPAFMLAMLLPLEAAAAPLTEGEVLRLGLSLPELSNLSRARLDAAEADAIEAATWPNPALELSRDRPGASREDTWRLAQPIDLSGRRGLREDAARRRVDAVAAENRARQSGQATELRLAFHEVLKQQEAVRAIDNWVARFAKIGDVVGKLARSGEASGYDKRRLVREQRTADAKLAEARADLERKRARLSALLGLPAVSADGVAGMLLPQAPAELPGLLARLEQRPDLAALAARAEAADNDNAAARRNFPEITVGVGHKRVDDGLTRESGPVLSLNIPLPLFDRQQGADRRTAAQAMAARAEHRLARQKAEGELLGLHRQVSQLIAAADRYRREAVAPSSDLVRIAEAAYRAGESTVLELLDAYKGALETETTALDLEWNAREASIELDQLTGSHPQ